MIKYIGSKRRLVPVLGDLFATSGARTALDLFTGTTRVAQEFKRRGAVVTAVDTARYSEIFAKCWIEASADDVSGAELAAALARLSGLPPAAGYFTETFCKQSRFFQPHNGARIDAIRNEIESEYAGSALYPMLLTSLILAADRVDSTTGLQMAYLKEWAPRAYNDLELRPPELIEGRGAAIRGDAAELAPTLGPFDFAYLDPPYNQHRYFTNYHVFETLVAWDEPEVYGVACKRIDSRDPSTKSVFNQKRNMPDALRSTIKALEAEVLVVSYNNEAWISLDELCDMCSHHDRVTPLSFDSKRYVGAQIGIHNPSGKKVGKVSHLRNLEYVVVAGPKRTVETMTAPYDRGHDASASGLCHHAAGRRDPRGLRSGMAIERSYG
ncbi:MAG: DNA adenine methylase [bacterium]|nr:DNA adenine methylase [bacterium]